MSQLIELFTHNGLYVGFFLGFLSWALGYALSFLFKVASM